MEDVAAKPPHSLSRISYSYAVVVAATLIGIVVPHHATAVLGPVLLLGLVGLGLAHGACDQLVVPAYQPVAGPWWRYLLRFVLGYLGLAAVVLLLWWRWPAATVGFFFLLTVWHWGSADAPALPHHRGIWVVHSALRGLLLFAVPAVAWPMATVGIINGLLTFAGAPPLAINWFREVVSALWPLVLAGHLLLWSWYAVLYGAQYWPRDVLEVALLTGLFCALPPLLALGVYFSFWHGLQHVWRLNTLLGSAHATSTYGLSGRALLQEFAFFIRRSLPLLLVSLAALLGLYALLAPRLVTVSSLVSLALVVASVVTLPHALLVSVMMDANKWKTPTRLSDSTSGLKR